MILKIIIDFFLGYVNITVEGFFVERFINNCINNKVFLWGLKRRGSSLLTVNINVRDFKKIHFISRRTKCSIKINSKHGFPILVHKYRKRKLLFIILIPIIITIVISSMFVWNIEIVGAENINTEELITQLKEEGIYIGNKKSNIVTKKTINNIRLKRDDISWMSINTKGTNVIVSIVESEKRPDIIDKNEYCNIVANKDGIITKITADSGTAIAKVGEIVKKGDILIGGYMEGKYTDKRLVHAKGNILAKTWYSKKIESGLTREVSNVTGNEKKRYSIKINNFQINLYKSIPKFENYDTIEKTNRLKLFSNLYLPIEIKKTIYIEKNIEEITYGKEELKNILISELQEEFLQDGIEKLNIVNKIANIYNKENNIMELEMVYEVIEEIGTEEKIN